MVLLRPTREELAALLGCSVRTLYRRSRMEPHRPQRRHRDHIRALLDVLRQLNALAGADRDGLLRWIERPHPDLAWRSPRQLFMRRELAPIQALLAAGELPTRPADPAPEFLRIPSGARHQR